jgi:hypothetical protein
MLVRFADRNWSGSGHDEAGEYASHTKTGATPQEEATRPLLGSIGKKKPASMLKSYSDAPNWGNHT